MRVATIVAVVVMSATAVTAPASVGVPAAGAQATAQPPRLLVALSEKDGSVLWRVKPRGNDGGFLDARLVTHGLVIAEEFRCGIGDGPTGPGDLALVAFDARTGKQRWRVPDLELSQGSFGRIDPPAADVAEVPVFNPDGEVPRLLDVATGTIVRPLNGVPVAASGDVLLVVALDAFRASASRRGIVTAFDRRTGAQRWTANLGANLFSVVAGRSTIAVAAGPIPDPGTALGQLGGLAALDPATGQKRWADQLMPGFGVELAGNRVLFQTLDRLYGVDTTSGQLAWNVAVDGTLDTSAARADLALTIRSPTFAGEQVTPGLLTAIDAATGNRRWQRDLTATLLDRGLATDRVVAVGSRDRIAAYDPTSGRERWTRPAPDSIGAVVAGGGRVYISGGCTVSND